MEIKQYKNADLYYRDKIFLLPGEIHIWCINWTGMNIFFTESWDLMTAQEKEQVKWYHYNDDKMRCAIGKIVTRLLLSQYLQVGNSKIEIYKKKYGKPYHKQIDGKKSVQFSISHSGEMVLVAFSYFENIGVDVEMIKDLPEFKRIAKNFFTKNEAMEIEKQNTPNMFYRYWTAKEAYLKALGVGIAQGMDSFAVINDIVTEKGEIKKDWKIFSIEINQGYAACVAVQAKANCR